MERNKLLRLLQKIPKPRYGAKTDLVRKAVTALAAVFLATALFCGAMLITTQLQYNESGGYYSKISSDISPAHKEKPPKQTVSITKEELQSIGEDIVGWISFPRLTTPLHSATTIRITVIICLTAATMSAARFLWTVQKAATLQAVILFCTGII